MKITTKGRYGLRAMVDLADCAEDGPVSINTIAARQNLSESYLEQLMAKLKKAGLIASSRGASGGYWLTKPATQISVGDVLRALEGNLEAAQCGALSDDGCHGAELCVTKVVWQRVNESINQAVDGIMLDELVQESRSVREKARRIDPQCFEDCH